MQLTVKLFGTIFTESGRVNFFKTHTHMHTHTHTSSSASVGIPSGKNPQPCEGPSPHRCQDSARRIDMASNMQAKQYLSSFFLRETESKTIDY